MIKLFDNNFSSNFKIINWNVANPSLKRASIQAKWIIKQDMDIIVLTECKNSKGCRLLENNLKLYGYFTFFQRPKNNEYGVIIASKYVFKPSQFINKIEYLPNRVASISIDNELEIIGTYIPSRGYDETKKVKKRKFLSNLNDVLLNKSRFKKRIFCGDFNILEPNHIPRYAIFEEWEYDFYDSLQNYDLIDAFRKKNPDINEYSWIGRNGNGYRYDHCFISTELLPHLNNCYYLHEPRQLKLSDHSAQICTFNAHAQRLSPSLCKPAI